MLNKLIEDIAHEKISLNQALTRTKILQSKIGAVDFKAWLAAELNGYKDREKVPDYRKVGCSIKGNFMGVGGAWTNVPLHLQNVADQLEIDMYQWVEMRGVDQIEKSAEGARGQMMSFGFPDQFVETLNSMYKRQGETRELYEAAQYVSGFAFDEMISAIRQKLLDTLLDLQDKFPELNDEEKISDEKSQAAQMVINNHIYGDNNNTISGVGETVTQSGNKQENSKVLEELISELKNAKVPEDLVHEISTIVKAPNDNTSKLSKAFNWIGRLSQKCIEKGIELQIPAITEKIQNLLGGS